MSSKFKTKIESLQAALTEYREAVQKINADQDLSPEGKDKKIGKLTDAIRSKAQSETAALWADLRKAEGGIQTTLSKAKADEAARWDYARIGIELTEARARLASVRSVAEADAIYKRESIADPHRARALRTALMETLPRFQTGQQSVEAALMLSHIKKDVETAARTPALDAVDQTANDLVSDVLAARKLTETLAGSLYPRSIMFEGGNPLTKLLNGVSVQEKFLPQLGKSEVTVEFLPETKEVNA